MNESTGVSSLTLALSARDELFPIREVARLTGVNPVTLRAWERRYGLIQPTRTDSGHRLYSMADVESVRSIQAWIRRGVPVSKVGDILARSAAGSAGASAAEAAGGEWGQWQEWQGRLEEALQSFDESELERVYGQILATWPVALALEEVLMPVWQGLALRTEEFGRTSEWLFLDAFLRSRIAVRLQMNRPRHGRRVLMAAVPGHCRDLELLVAALLLAGEQQAVTLLPLGQPLDELALVCERARPEALVLFSNRPLAADLQRQLGRMVLTLGCPLALAGEAAELAGEAFAGTPVACLGRPSGAMAGRLKQLLDGHLDT
ncbi:MerR family transcriptional regulator [Stutzerimonas tarimensis]|uniref:MerR family transcriptional regulator n=1 Tax=Stutzerimonas tarimensis TaxID=1507735 RepID=A0ABV7T580_9GAMM